MGTLRQNIRVILSTLLKQYNPQILSSLTYNATGNGIYRIPADP